MGSVAVSERLGGIGKFREEKFRVRRELSSVPRRIYVTSTASTQTDEMT